MTLVEIMVAMAIFSILGMTLALFLRQGLTTWRTGESRRGVYEEAQALVRQLRDDLRSAFTAAPDAPGAGPRARFICDLDPAGRQRLAFIRTVAAEARHPLAALAGNAIGADRYLDGEHDREEAVGGHLRATGGLMEVLYALDPDQDGVLLRGARAPPGGPESLFALENVEELPRLRALARPLSTHVLHLELAFWTQTTEKWEDAAASWDSTRALVPDAAGAPTGAFKFFRGEASLDDPEDDVFPERVRVTLVVAEEGPAATWSALAAPLKSGQVEMRVLNARPFETRGPYLRVGRGKTAEWVRVKSVDPVAGTLRLEARALRGTKERDHAGGADVVTGRMFMTEIEVPAAAEDWGR